MRTIIEIGSYTGEYTKKFLGDENALVYAFEPNKSHFNKLITLSHTYPTLHPIPFAVGWGDNFEPLFHDPDDRNYSLEPMGTKYSGKEFTLTWTIRLDTFMEMYNVPCVDFLHIDAPFSEEACLCSLGDKFKSIHAGSVVVYSMVETIDTVLQDFGFRVQGQDVIDTNQHVLNFWRML